MNFLEQKSEIFQTLRKQYALLGISNAPVQSESYNLSKKKLVFGFLLFGCNIAAQIVTIFHVASDFMERVNSISVSSGLIIIFVCFAATVFRKTSLFDSIDSIEKIIDSRRKYPKSMKLFMETSRRVERVCAIVFMVIMKIIVQFIMLPKCTVSFGIYFLTEAGSDSFELPYPLWFPFDTTSPIGYFIAAFIEYILLGYEYFIIACTLSLGVGGFWLAISATKEIQHILHLINVEVQANESQSNELKILFSDFVNIHGIAKQLIHDFSAIFQPIIMSLFTWSLLAISAAMFIFQMEILHHGNVMPLLVLILNGFFALTAVFIACELGQRMNNAFDEIDYTLDNFDWYLFSIEIQRMLPMIIANAQQPVSLECFGSIACTRDVFKDVLHCAYSYFTVLRQLGE